jgi:O-antigen ligase
MDKFIKESYIYKIIVSIWNFICNLFSNSFLVNMFLKERSTEEIQKETIFSKLINRVINGIRKIFEKLKLDKLLNNSIFTKPIIWVSLVTGLTPFLPTMAVLLLVLLSMGSLFLKIILDKEFKFKRSNVNVWILLFILVYMFSAFTSLSTAEYKNIFMLTVSFILFYFVVINTVDTKKKLNVLLYIFISSATIASLYGLYQYAYGDLYSQAWLDKNMFEDIKMRVYSTFENPNVFGEYLILVIPIIVGLFFREKGIKKKVLLLGMLGINTLALVFTFSRGCWLGILFALAILAVVIDRRFILLGVLLLMLAPFVLPESIINRFTSIGNMKDTSTSYRVAIWMGTIAMLKDYWFSGIGLGISSFNKVFPIYAYSGTSAQHSHNLYLQIMVENGIMGLIMFFGIMYNFYKETVISICKKKDIVLVGIITGMIGFLIQSMTDHTWYNYRIILIFWMIIGFGISLAKLNQEEK